MSAVDELLNKAIRRHLQIARAKQKEAIHWQDEPAQRRAAKSIALYTSKLFCLHPFVEQKRLRVHGRDKFSLKCNSCKAYALTE